MIVQFKEDMSFAFEFIRTWASCITAAPTWVK